MTEWYYLILAFAAGILTTWGWFWFRISSPLTDLLSQIRRLKRGEKINAWEVNGAAPVRKAAKGLAELFEILDGLKEDQNSMMIELESVLSGIDEAVIIVDKNGVIKVSNHNFKQFFMVDEDPSGKRLRDLVQVFEVNDVVDQSLQSGEEQGDFVSLQMIQDKKSVVRNYQLISTPLKDTSGKAFSCLLVVADYSRLKEMESVEHQMVASVSHELRTPLAIFKGYLEALIDIEADGNEETLRILGVLTRHSNRLNQLVEDLLILSRVQEKALSPIYEPIEIHEFLERVREDSEHFLDKDIILETEVGEGIEMIVMDEFRMEQVFHNLIDNAQRHSDDSKSIRIGVKRNLDLESFKFFVKDYGVGIPSDKLSMIFNRFYRVDRARSRERGGTGLGLSIVREIMKAQGGGAWAESELGKGTTIWLTLPDRVHPHAEE